jgi:hypothetical protein
LQVKTKADGAVRAQLADSSASHLPLIAINASEENRKVVLTTKKRGAGREEAQLRRQKINLSKDTLAVPAFSTV